MLLNVGAVINNERTSTQQIHICVGDIVWHYAHNTQHCTDVTATTFDVQVIPVSDRYRHDALQQSVSPTALIADTSMVVSMVFPFKLTTRSDGKCFRDNLSLV